MGLRGDLGTLRGIRMALRSFPKTLAVDVAKRAAPAMTELAQGAYDGGRNVYGDTRPASKVDGSPLDLVRTGATRAQVRFTAIGTRIICALGPPYAKYLVGRYKILPSGDLTAIPASWAERMRAIVAESKGPE